MTKQNSCPDIHQSDIDVLTGIRPRMSEEYRRKVFFPAMFKLIQNYKDKGETIQTAFNELSRLTGYKLSYLKNTYYELLKIEADSTKDIDENFDPLSE